MSNYRKDVLEIETQAQVLMLERGEILRFKRALTASEVDRLFDITTEIDRCFEYQSMLLPLIEDPKTQGRWDSHQTI